MSVLNKLCQYKKNNWSNCLCKWLLLYKNSKIQKWVCIIVIKREILKEVFLTCHCNGVGSWPTTEHAAVAWTASCAVLGGDQQIMGKGRKADTIHPVGDGSKLANTTLDEAVWDGSRQTRHVEWHWSITIREANRVAAHNKWTVHEEFHSSKNRIQWEDVCSWKHNILFHSYLWMVINLAAALHLQTNTL